MPSVKFKFIAMAAAALALTAGAVWYSMQPPKRAFNAGYIPQKLNRNYPRSVFSSKGVVNRIIQVKLVHDHVATDAEKTTVRAELTMPFDFNNRLNYRWKLGENVILHEGSLTGELNNLPKGTTDSIQITVSGFSKENNHHIAFEIFGHESRRTISGDSLIASDPESTFEDIVQNVERIKASQ